jgi:hypothetical protein
MTSGDPLGSRLPPFQCLFPPFRDFGHAIFSPDFDPGLGRRRLFVMLSGLNARVDGRHLGRHQVQLKG